MTIQTNIVRVENLDRTFIVSDTLRMIMEVAENMPNAPEVQAESIDDKESKGELIVVLLVGLATNAIYDILKAIVARLSKRNDFSPYIRIKIGDTEVTFGSFLDD